MSAPQFVWYHEDVRPDGTADRGGGYWADPDFDEIRGIRIDGCVVGEYDAIIETVASTIGKIELPEPRPTDFVLQGGYGFDLVHKGVTKWLYIVCFRPNDTRIKNGCRYEVSLHLS